MTIFIVILLTASCILLGKVSKAMGMKQYMVVFMITLIQVAFFIFVFLTMEKPPGF